jgi:phosphatidate phosphatase APP1
LHETEKVSVAVLDLSSSEHELRQNTEHIRRRWPDAEILLVGDNLDHLDDPLYDERVSAEIQPSELLTVVERLVAHKRRASRFRRRRIAEGKGRYGA